MTKQRSKRSVKMWAVFGGIHNEPDYMYATPKGTRDAVIYSVRQIWAYRPWNEIRLEQKFRCIPVTVTYSIPKPRKAKRK